MGETSDTDAFFVPASLEELLSLQQEAPYTKNAQAAARRTANNEVVLQMMKRLPLGDVILFLFSFLGAALYLCFYPVFELISAKLRSITTTWRSSTALSCAPSYYCMANKRSEGVISTHVCKKTGRTYVTRFLDLKRDLQDASGVLVSGTQKCAENIATTPTVRHRNNKKMHLSSQTFNPVSCEATRESVTAEARQAESEGG